MRHGSIPSGDDPPGSYHSMMPDAFCLRRLYGELCMRTAGAKDHGVLNLSRELSYSQAFVQ